VNGMDYDIARMIDSSKLAFSVRRDVEWRGIEWLQEEV